MIPAITHRDIMKAGVPEHPGAQLIAEMTGRSAASIRSSIHQGKLIPSRDGLFQYLNSPGKERFRENFRAWAKKQEKRGLYSLSQKLPDITISEVINA
jgi:hypothetical protein